jgi:hypothetical protein
MVMSHLRRANASAEAVLHHALKAKEECYPFKGSRPCPLRHTHHCHCHHHCPCQHPPNTLAPCQKDGPFARQRTTTRLARPVPVRGRSGPLLRSCGLRAAGCNVPNFATLLFIQSGKIRGTKTFEVLLVLSCVWLKCV